MINHKPFDGTSCATLRASNDKAKNRSPRKARKPKVGASRRHEQVSTFSWFSHSPFG